uniref:NnrU domain-containing protein n=1 Tax=Attheya septentrionalis TaxID=420275 RepID=A0A7S2UFW7_9STRA|mmetsp:Transcript_242/g.396  ORF Transcript_242/g.396 Transcript_242/m.396 type:complete len:406 (+) Transcript_242:164-1381(+)
MTSVIHRLICRTAAVVGFLVAIISSVDSFSASIVPWSRSVQHQHQHQHHFSPTRRRNVHVNSSLAMSSSDESSSSSIPEIPFLTKSVLSDRSRDLGVGEDSGIFDIANEEWGALGERGWLTFSAAVGTILTAVAVLWVYAPTGYADDFTAFLEHVAGGNSHIVTLIYGIVFPVMHSGLASLRPLGEKIVGARTWRVIFAFPSLCLSYSWITYFIAHAHDGLVFYDLSHIGWAHALAWVVNFTSFLFLYPTVFNLKEVAAVEVPKIHLWETGVIRITRHPQFIGQVMWSAGHLAMVGSSFSALTMALLVGHHYFSCWNGDRRLFDEHGEDFLKIKERTSIIPFKAIVEGRQELPTDYYKELLRAPYALIAVGTVGAYFAHPYMQAGAALVRNTGLVEGGIFNGILH